MKKFLFTLCTGLVSVTAFSNSAYAQRSEKSSSAIESKSFISSVRYLAASENKTMSDISADEKNMNTRAIKDFQVRFKQVDDARWFVNQKGGFVSYFVRNGYGNRVIYDKKGRWLVSLILYSEAGLPRDIRTRIKSIYYDFAIVLAGEVQTAENTEYVVYLADKSTIHILRLDQNGDVQTEQEVGKGTSKL